MARGNRLPDCEVQARVAKVAELLLAGLGRSQIVQFCADKWETGNGTADRYISEAIAQFREQFAPDIKAETQKALARYESIFARCMASQNYREAAAAQDRVCKLLGLFKAERVEVEHAGEVDIVVKIGGTLGPRNG